MPLFFSLLYSHHLVSEYLIVNDELFKPLHKNLDYEKGRGGDWYLSTSTWFVQEDNRSMEKATSSTTEIKMSFRSDIYLVFSHLQHNYISLGSDGNDAPNTGIAVKRERLIFGFFYVRICSTIQGGLVISITCNLVYHHSLEVNHSDIWVLFTEKRQYTFLHNNFLWGMLYLICFLL